VLLSQQLLFSLRPPFIIPVYLNYLRLTLHCNKMP
jgi:hypothetical protein